MIIIYGKVLKVSGFNTTPNCNNLSGRGTSIITKYSSDYIWYRRGKSTMRISIKLIEKIIDYILVNCKGKSLSTKDIKNIKDIVCPGYKGWHDCDATFIMMILRNLFGAKIVDKRPICVVL